MNELDIRYTFILLPLLYVILPFIFSGSFVFLGGVTLIAFIIGVVIFIIISNLNIGGSGEVLASGVSGKISLNSEAGYSLFVVCIGGIFYLGAQLTILITPLLDIFIGIINAILSFVCIVFGISTSGFQTSLFNGLGNAGNTNLGKWYPLGITIQGISVFGALDLIMGSMFILGLYFMVHEPNG